MKRKSRFIGTVLKGFEIIDFIPATESSNAKFVGKCLKCGNIITRSTTGFKQLNSRISCSCSYKYSYHNESHSRLYSEYMNMKGRANGRCGGEKNKKYYLNKGIRICDEWNKPTGYLAFKKWVLSNGYTDDLTLDRIDNNGDYEPSNCRWTTVLEQNLNRSNTLYAEINGVKKPVVIWADELGVRYDTVIKRIKRGRTPEQALLFERK